MASGAIVVHYLDEKLAEKLKDPAFRKEYYRCDTEGCDHQATWIRHLDGYQLCSSCITTETQYWEIEDFSPIQFDDEASPTPQRIS